MGKVQRPKLPVSERALLQRINRRLRAADERVLKARRRDPEIGDYYRIDFRRNFFVEGNVDLESTGREVGALRPWEALEKE